LMNWGRRLQSPDMQRDHWASVGIVQANKSQETTLMRLSRFPRRFLVVACFVAGICAPCLHAEKAAAALDVIPEPAQVEIQPGTFELGPKIPIDLETNSRGAHWVGEYLSRLLSKPTGHTLPVHITDSAGLQHNAIIFRSKAQPRWVPRATNSAFLTTLFISALSRLRDCFTLSRPCARCSHRRLNAACAWVGHSRSSACAFRTGHVLPGGVSCSTAAAPSSASVIFGIRSI